MEINSIRAISVNDSRKDKTIQVSVKTPKGKFYTNAPTGKSVGRFEQRAYFKSLQKDICKLLQNLLLFLH